MLLLATEVVSTKMGMEELVETWSMESSHRIVAEAEKLAQTPPQYH